jgi:hypothetical protein
MKSSNIFLYGIVIAIVVPIVLLIAFVIFSSSNSFKLVEKDYYQKEIHYQSQIDREVRTNQLEKDVSIYSEGEAVTLQFPLVFSPDDINGDIIFFRPSNSNDDFNVQIDLNEYGRQIINNTEMRGGAWIVKVFWNNQLGEYYTEKRIYVIR